MVSALHSGSSGLAQAEAWTLFECFFVLGQTLNSHSRTLRPDVQMGTGKFNAGDNPTMD